MISMPVTDNIDDVWTLDSGQPMFYDRQGVGISARRANELMGDPSYKILRSSVVGEHTVTTAWLSTDQGGIFERGEKPWIFGTMTARGSEFLDASESFASSEEQALQNHEAAVAALAVASLGTSPLGATSPSPKSTTSPIAI